MKDELKTGKAPSLRGRTRLLLILAAVVMGIMALAQVAYADDEIINKKILPYRNIYYLQDSSSATYQVITDVICDDTGFILTEGNHQNNPNYAQISLDVGSTVPLYKIVIPDGAFKYEERYQGASAESEIHIIFDLDSRISGGGRYQYNSVESLNDDPYYQLFQGADPNQQQYVDDYDWNLDDGPDGKPDVFLYYTRTWDNETSSNVWHVFALTFITESERKAELQDALETAQSDLQTANTNWQNAQSALSSAQAAVTAAEAELSQANTDKKAAEDALVKANEDKKAAEDALAEANEDKKAAEDAVTKVEQDLAQAKADKEAVEKALEEAKANELTELGKASLKSVKGGKKKLNIKWNKVTDAKGYEIIIAKNKACTKDARTYTVKKGSTLKKTVKKLAKGKYFVKVRAYKAYKGNTVYGAFSKAKAAKVK